MNKFKTISKNAEGLYKEKGSKFLAYAFYVENETEVHDHLEEVKKMHHKARHVCWGSRLGISVIIERANDDGEPSGTAGRPILGQIHSHGLHNVLVVVVRYFGGTKLGTSGLIRAYKTSADDSLENAGIRKMQIVEPITISLPYEKVNDFLQFMGSRNLRFTNQEYSGKLGKFTFEIPLVNREKLLLSLRAMLWNKYEEEVEKMEWPKDIFLSVGHKKAITE